MQVDVNKISNNTKSIVFLIMLIGEGAWLVFSIQANHQEIKTTDARSEKRYKRGMEVAKDHEVRLRKLEAFMSFTKGSKSK